MQSNQSILFVDKKPSELHVSLRVDAPFAFVIFVHFVKKRLTKLNIKFVLFQDHDSQCGNKANNCSFLRQKQNCAVERPVVQSIARLVTYYLVASAT